MTFGELNIKTKFKIFSSGSRVQKVSDHGIEVFDLKNLSRLKSKLK